MGLLGIRETINHAKANKERMDTLSDRAVEWDEDKTKFQHMLVLKASTYNPHRLFDVEPISMDEMNAQSLPDSKCAISPTGQFRYTEAILSRGRMLDLIRGDRRTKVCFDDDVVIPRLNERRSSHAGFMIDPWMSMTPMEVMTQRYAIRRAKGHVVIAGLGMGWMLRKVAARKQVRAITLVEISQELIDWVMPTLGISRDIEIICGDAREIVPSLTADVALTDIDESYGGNRFPTCPNIEYVWTWGDQYVR